MKTLHFKAHLLKIFKIFAKPKGGKIKFHYETKQNQAKNKKRFRQIHFVYLLKIGRKKACIKANCNCLKGACREKKSSTRRNLGD